VHVNLSKKQKKSKQLKILNRSAPTKGYYSKKPAAATVFEDVVVLVEVTVYNPSRR
jgi:hypothetical protein